MSLWANICWGHLACLKLLVLNSAIDTDAGNSQRVFNRFSKDVFHELKIWQAERHVFARLVSKIIAKKNRCKENIFILMFPMWRATCNRIIASVFIFTWGRSLIVTIKEGRTPSHWWIDDNHRSKLYRQSETRTQTWTFASYNWKHIRRVWVHVNSFTCLDVSVASCLHFSIACCVFGWDHLWKEKHNHLTR